MTDAQITTAIADIATDTPNTALEIRNLFTELFNRSYKTGDIMMVSCSNDYIIANFDGTGLGINERVGWAICNNNNGTRNYDDRLPLPYGTSNLTMGAPKGANTATLLTKNLPPITGTAAGPYTGTNIVGGGGFDGGGNIFKERAITINPQGTSVAFSIEPKTIVTLFIQKINV